MKLGHLRSLGHNLAHSMASGIGLPIGLHEMDIFGEAATSSAAHITVDFLSGATAGATPSPSLLRAIHLYRNWLPDMCRTHGFDLADVKMLVIRFGTDQVYGQHFRVSVESAWGRSSTDQYIGQDGRKMRRAVQP